MGILGLGAVLIGAIGLFMPWATGGTSGAGGLISASFSTAGIDGRPDGIIFLVLLIAAAIFGIWNLISPSRNGSLLFFLSWTAILAYAVYEYVFVNARSGSYSSELGQALGVSSSISVGTGLKVCALAGIVGTIIAVLNISIVWSRSGAKRTRLTATVISIAVFAVVAGGIIGHVRANSGSTNNVNVGGFNVGLGRSPSVDPPIHF